ncbi:hypothetical protein A3F02_00540 [Candidatus Curtissbacteria bacterium RIFCSPHIGHO2_12_FULL_38_9b]|uniref:Cysteine desulfurase n=1 Tax=Candidatus Curtissbacteria bacterium RIFCSPHIGHO2_12_FULL_38_9b TaxID=1797720 RepID=A0A1F5GYI7_9BACT|nr:MAG: hypothetical protein A3F02_00540 [Candidatus Curtissbacteria bacterium RIFCSPHIGHO2_12_FULL_38_9b]
MTYEVRQKFPFLKRKYGRQGFSLAYLDNASTTQKPQVVIDTISDVYKNHYANIHRGVYDLSVEATDLYEGVRAKVAKFIGAKDSGEVIFTKNTTESLNLLAYCQGESLTGGDEILLTEMEHHSNIVPWQMLRDRMSDVGCRIKIKYIPIDSKGRLELGKLDKLVTKKTKIVSLTLMSNVLGTINPIKEIVKRIRELSTVNREPAPLVLIDAAQAVSHMKVDVGDLGCDFLVFSAHKMYGPVGVGVLYGKREILSRLPPFLSGGDMILSVSFDKTTFNEIPWKFEAGTPNIADVIAFGEAIGFLEKLGYEYVGKYEMGLTKYALERFSKDPDIDIFGPKDLKERGPVVSFNVANIHPHDVASILSEEGVAIRSGHHCAQPLMGVLGIDFACRASFGVYNTKEEIDWLIEGIKKVKKVFRI